MKPADVGMHASAELEELPMAGSAGPPTGLEGEQLMDTHSRASVVSNPNRDSFLTMDSKRMSLQPSEVYHRQQGIQALRI